jgi:hypothetical protein
MKSYLAQSRQAAKGADNFRRERVIKPNLDFGLKGQKFKILNVSNTVHFSWP